MQLHETSIFPQCPAMQMSTGEWKIAAIVAKMAAERKSEILSNVGTTTKDMRELELPGQENRNLLSVTLKSRANFLGAINLGCRWTRSCRRRGGKDLFLHHDVRPSLHNRFVLPLFPVDLPSACALAHESIPRRTNKTERNKRNHHRSTSSGYARNKLRSTIQY